MSRFFCIFTSHVLLVSALLGGIGSASADNREAELVFDLGVGALVKPEWEGAKDVMLSPFPIFRPQVIRLGPINVGTGPKRAFSLRPSFGIVGEREGEGDLTGLDDVDTSVELGAAASLRYGMLEASLALRRGVTGHNGFVGEASVQAVLDPTDRWTISFGPEVTFGDEAYMETYFGVSPAEAAASSFNTFDPDAGIKSVGLIASTRYTLTESWSLIGQASAHHLVGDAADSPIVEDAGSEVQFSAGVGAAYRFKIDLFD